MFGSAFPVELGRVTFGPKLAGAGGVGGRYALGPLLCFVNQVLFMQLVAGQSGVRLSGYAMFALPAGSRVTV